MLHTSYHRVNRLTGNNQNLFVQERVYTSLSRPVYLKHDGTDGTLNTDGTAIERADGTANTGVN